MAHEWNIKPRGRMCSSCSRDFQDGDECLSTLLRTEDGYQRVDLCEGCEAQEREEPEIFSQWQWDYEVPPPPPSRKEPVKQQTAEALLRRLIMLEDPANANVIYILAVMLERKKQLIERDVRPREEGGVLRVYEHRVSGDTFIVLDPQLRLDEIGEVQRQVIELLSDPERGAVEAGRDDFDIIIRNGRVVDGSGAPSRMVDVGVLDGRVKIVGEIDEGATATKYIDASGMLVTPGFIDVHSHSDAYLLVEPDAPSKTSQGVTTEVVGQCGCSAAPLRGQARHPSDWEAVLSEVGISPKDNGVEFWRSIASYRAALEERRHAPNVVALVGHNVLRAGVMGYEGRAAAPEEVAEMVKRLEAALDEGASGFTTGLIYSRGASSERVVVLSLGRAAAAKGAHYATHMRSEGARLVEAVEEVLRLTRATGIRTQISHLKTGGKDNWGKLDQVLELIESAKEDGYHVFADRYPYVYSGTSLDTRLPKWAQPDGREAIMSRLNDPLTARRIIDELESSDEESWRSSIIGSTVNPALLRFRGRSVYDVSQEWSCSCAEAFVQILRLDKNETGAFFGSMSEDNLKRIFAQPWVMVGSDGSIRATEGPLSHDYPHPRGYASFVRFLRLAVAGEWGFSLEEAVRKMTSLPADAFRLEGRGRVVEGAWADILVIDERRLADGSSFALPHRYAEGIRQVIVNGVMAYEDGAALERPGRWLVSGAPD